MPYRTPYRTSTAVCHEIVREAACKRITSSGSDGISYTAKAAEPFNVNQVSSKSWITPANTSTVRNE